jgi:hypothetical protein
MNKAEEFQLKLKNCCKSLEIERAVEEMVRNITTSIQVCAIEKAGKEKGGK